MLEDYTWLVQVGDKTVHSAGQPLSSLPQLITTVSKLIQSIHRLDGLNVCVGNADEKYHPLQVARKGVFRDPTGIIIIIF